MTPAGLIVDTSALVAIARGEAGYPALREALLDDLGLIPAPVVVEFQRVMATAGNRPDPAALQLIVDLADLGTHVHAFDAAAAAAAVAANELYGSGSGRGSPLNLLDLMVYGVARVTGLPILCTGFDFARTDIAIHPSSRPS